MFGNEVPPPLEQMLDLAVAATSVALLPMGVAAWATLKWIRGIEAAHRPASGAPLDKARATA